MESTNEILQRRLLSKQFPTVNSNNNYTTTVNSELTNNKFDSALEELSGNPNYVAEQLAEKLCDKKSERYYKVLVDNIGAEKLLEALSITLDANRSGRVKYMPVYFQGILRNWGLRTKFSRE